LQQNLTARDFALANNVQSPFYSIGGTVYQSSTGLAASNPAQYVAMGGKGDFSDVQKLSAPVNPANMQAVQFTDAEGNVVKGFINLATGQFIDPEALANATGNGDATSTGGSSAGVVSTANGSYDLSTYDPSNPNYASTISGIASTINSSSSTGSIETAADAQNYIDSVAPNSPVTGDMVIQAAEQTNTDPATIMAIMQEESNFNTNPNAVTDTANNDPGSIMGGPNGTQTAFSTTQDGVTGIGTWLANHTAKNANLPLSPSDPNYATATVPGSGGLTQAYIDAAAEYLNTTGQMMGGSRATTGKGGLQSTAIKNRAAQLLNGGSIAANAQSYAYGKTTQAQGGMAAINNALLGINALETFSAAVPRGNFTVTNAAQLQIQAKTSDPATVAFVTAVNAFADDIGAALGAGQGATDAKLQLGQTLADPNYSPAAFNAQLSALSTFLSNRMQSIQSQASGANNSNNSTDPVNYVNSLGIGSGTSDADTYLNSIGATLQ
jgi:hypothetical protein